MSFHLCERPFHFAEHPYRVGGQIRMAIPLMSRNQMSLAVNPKALVENLLFPDLNSLLGRNSSIGHAIETPVQSKGSLAANGFGRPAEDARRATNAATNQGAGRRSGADCQIQSGTQQSVVERPGRACLAPFVWQLREEWK
jgi:hypothetical protein